MMIGFHSSPQSSTVQNATVEGRIGTKTVLLKPPFTAQNGVTFLQPPQLPYINKNCGGNARTSPRHAALLARHGMAGGRSDFHRHSTVGDTNESPQVSRRRVHPTSDVWKNLVFST